MEGRSKDNPEGCPNVIWLNIHTDPNHSAIFCQVVSKTLKERLRLEWGKKKRNENSVFRKVDDKIDVKSLVCSIFSLLTLCLYKFFLFLSPLSAQYSTHICEIICPSCFMPFGALALGYTILSQRKWKNQSWILRESIHGALKEVKQWEFTSGVPPDLWDLMPNDLRW